MDVRELLERQTEWQKARKDLSWPDKIRMVEAIRESILQLMRTNPRISGSAGTTTPPA